TRYHPPFSREPWRPRSFHPDAPKRSASLTTLTPPHSPVYVSPPPPIPPSSPDNAAQTSNDSPRAVRPAHKRPAAPDRAVVPCTTQAVPNHADPQPHIPRAEDATARMRH